ncbi:MAG: FAD-dependent oxidoreductase [Paludibacter sp.]|jgi:sulfide:quinone oxidoreductase|nr:FAD-dependent oxidoreductase [Paludibacter sp.]
MKKVLVLGGGFAGVEAAIALQKSKQFEVTLVSNRDYLYLYPVSIWIPVDGIKFENVKLPLKKIQKAFPFRLIVDKVIAIQSAENKVQMEKQSLDYDYLVVAIGADKLQPKGVENTFTICGSPEGNLAFRDAFQTLVKKGKGSIAIGFGGNPNDKSAVRGGPGFELIFNIDHYLRKKGLRDQFELNFFAPMDQPGARMGKGAMKMMGTMFKKKNLHQHYGKKIKLFEKDGVVFEDDSKLQADLTMFIAAGTGSFVFKNSDLPLTSAGFIHIDQYCKVVGSENVWAVGDSAGLEGTDFVAKQGHLAEIMGRFAANNILQTATGGQNFQNYQEHISILCVMDTGDGAAYVYRDSKKEFIIPMPVVGHWMKKGWGLYQKWTKTGKMPRIPGL